MPPNPIDIIVSIPEFQIALRAVLTRRELFNTILVSKHWYQALLAAYWHTLEIGALLADPPSELVGQVGHLVHSLTLNKYTALELYAQHCTELRELTVKTFNITSPTLSKHWPWLITLLQQNPRLYTFHLNLRNKLVGPVSHVVKAFSIIPHLTTASLITSTPLDTNLILDLLVQCPLLQYLTVGSMFTIHVLPSDPYFATLGSDVMFPHLRRLNVSSVFGYDMIREILIPVWRRAPQIETFSVPFDIRFGREFLDELQALVRRSCHHIRDLSLASHTMEICDWVDPAVAELVSATAKATAPAMPSNQFSNLKFYYCDIGTLTMAAITTHHASSLESLILIGCGRTGWQLPSESIATVLQSCPKLKVFKVNKLSVHATQEDFVYCILDAHDAIQQPWVCLELEHLEIRIGGICRPHPQVSLLLEAAKDGWRKHGSNDTEQQWNVEQKRGARVDANHFFTREHQEQCHKIQRQIFQQIGKLKRLKYLILGDHRTIRTRRNVEEDIQWFNAFGQFDCLDFRLALGTEAVAGGLECLASLNRLELLNVVTLSHNIGLEEVSWMVSYWPRLQTLEGLAHVYNNSNTLAIRYLQEQHPSVLLR